MEDIEDLEGIERIHTLAKIKKAEKIGQVLGYGIPIHTFIDKFDTLSPEKKDVLERVAQRLETIKKLSYEAFFISNPQVDNGPNIQFGGWELPSLQIYLYCTCMDTLAGKEKYLKFHEWLKMQDLSNLDGTKIDEYYKSYNKTEGNREGFRRLFNGLSPQVKTWLNTNIAIQKSNEYEVLIERDQDDFLRRLIEYFYSYWRNSFTHNSMTQPVDIFGLDYLRNSLEETNEWHQESTNITFGESKTKWSLWHKKELDIFIIARVIIHSIAFQWLDVEITDELINKNVHFLNRLQWMYLYIDEIRENAHDLDLWKELEEEYGQKFVSDLRNSGIFLLRYKASSRMLEFFWSNNGFEVGLRKHIQEYINHITEINAAISNFNRENPRLRDFHSQEEEQRCKQKIFDFLSKLTKESAYKEIIKHSHQAWNIWLLIRDNHDYESKNIRDKG
jgi:hypothetical protein